MRKIFGFIFSLLFVSQGFAKDLICEIYINTPDGKTGYVGISEPVDLTQEWSEFTFSSINQLIQAKVARRGVNRIQAYLMQEGSEASAHLFFGDGFVDPLLHLKTATLSSTLRCTRIN